MRCKFKYFFVKIYVLNRFNVLILKIIFLKIKNIINIYLNIKSYLKNNRYRIIKYTLTIKYLGVRLSKPSRV